MATMADAINHALMGHRVVIVCAVRVHPRYCMTTAPTSRRLGAASVLNAKLWVAEFTVKAGPHRIEIRAPGYQTLTVDVRVAPQETVTYRGALESTRPSVWEPDRLAASTAPIYVIPNCYLGNIPPRPQQLRPWCDVKNVQILGGK